MPHHRTLMVYVEPTTYIVDLIRAIRAAGAEQADVVFIAENVSQKWNVPLQDVPHEVLPAGRLLALRALYRKLRGGRYDVLHLAGWGHPQLLIALVVGWCLRIPVTMETDTPLPYRLSGWKRLIKEATYPWLFRIPARFLPGGARQAAYLKHYAVEDRRINIAYMTVDIAAIAAHKEAASATTLRELRAAQDIDPVATVFLYVGRMEPHKGIRELIQAVGLLASEPHFALLLVGEGSLSAEVAAAAAKDARIRHLGRLSGTDLLSAYTMAEVFVLPSNFEPWGLVVNEAMAAGLPVIATDRVGCIDDLVRVGVTGVVVPAECPDALADAMREFIQDPPALRRLGQNARLHIAPWTIARSAEVIRSTWQEVSSCRSAA